ncbi:uncharacterized protein F5147DRAFT_572996 [Suillus discolor]|uniref:Uncharacterized protein n=1 Tax=Suillus discolor TaxID=1912936 RepID=A0A9P7JWB3_9AGAM|nr:uncharacterized protein F5147DRAFT_572996 [Suillus discolor]KAG2112064.1 hypothetical protein F5147DRAFT_572996 [Suillus discolor]
MASLHSALKATNCAVENIFPEHDDPTICPACHKRLKTAQGVQAHLRSAKSCTWYKMEKLKALSMPGQFEEEVVSQDLPDTDTLPEGLPEEHFLPDDDVSDQMEPQDVMEGFHEELFQLIPAHDVDMDAPGPSNLSNDDDDRLTEEHPTAGQHICIVSMLYERWKKLFGGRSEVIEDQDINMEDEDGASHKFTPFASELDWRIARAVIP